MNAPPRARSPHTLVVVHADDLGYSPAVNRGIVRAHAAGIVTSTSFMANLESSADGAACALRTPALEVGLHLNLTMGAPLTPAKSLLRPDGKLRSISRQLLALATGALNEDEIFAEATAQLARARALGLTITHIDGHEHVHLFGAARRATFRLARAEGLIVRRPREAALVDIAVDIRYTIRKWLLAAGARGPEWAGVPHADALVDLTGPHARRTPEWLVAEVAKRRGVIEVLCHPGESDPTPGDTLRPLRPQDLAVLTASGLRDRLADVGATLSTFQTALARPATPAAAPAKAP